MCEKIYEVTTMKIPKRCNLLIFFQHLFIILQRVQIWLADILSKI
jgi:hypothetical protein